MRKLFIAAAASLSLAGCSTTDMSGLDLAAVDVVIGKNLPKICAGSDAAYAGFVAVSAIKPVTQKTAARVAAARAVLRPLCADPERARSGDVIAAAFNSFLAIKAARDAARA